MPRLLHSTVFILFFLCLAPMPYGYYAFVRFVAMVGFGLLAYNAKQEEQGMLALIYLCLALLFQPFFKIAMGRTLWNVVDVVLGVWLVAAALGARSK